MAIKKIKLSCDERIVAVVPEKCYGPGWSNAPTWVYIQARDGTIRVECIQPDECTPELRALHEAGDALHRALVKAVPVERV